MQTKLDPRAALGPLPALRWLAGALLSQWLAGCAATPTIAPVQRLRITNQGTAEIKALTVLFPGVRLDFGDLAPGATTAYQAVPGGVLAYAAYEFEIGGQVAQQPVIDWIGEAPLPGADFTYQLDFDPGRWVHNEAIQLLGVSTDP